MSPKETRLRSSSYSMTFTVILSSSVNISVGWLTRPQERSVICSKPSIPPKSTKTPKSVIFFTRPSRMDPTSNSLNKASLCSLRLSSRIILWETTMFFRDSLSFTIRISISLSRYTSKSWIGLISICEPGKKACTIPRSTIKPPLIRRTTVPAIMVSFSNASLKSRQRRIKSAFSFERIVFPLASSINSRYTST